MRSRSFYMFCLLSLLLVGTSRADTIKIYNLDAILQYGTVTGTVTLDETTGTFTAANLTANYGLMTSTFSSPPASYVQNSTYDVTIFNGSLFGSTFALDLPVTSLVSYAGGTLCSTSAFCTGSVASAFNLPLSGSDYVTSGSLAASTTTTVTLEPSTLLLLGTGVVVAAGFVRRRMHNSTRQGQNF